MSGDRAIAGATVTLYAARTGRPRVLGRAVSGRNGGFRIRDPKAHGPNETRYLIADGGRVGTRPDNPAIRLATVLGRGPAPADVTINERTTVATAFALAQFIDRFRIKGPAPGLPNAAANVRNLVKLGSARTGRVLRRAPNGRFTPTLRTFNSLSNLLARCVRNAGSCDRLFDLSDPRGVTRPATTLAVAHTIARNPAHRVRALFRRSLTTRVYRPALGRGDTPSAWTLALRYDGGGGQLNGPGQVAFDEDGDAWIVNNYVFSRRPLDPQGIVCGDDHVLHLEPNGRNAKGAPYQGGGTYGAGYGVGIDRDGDIWVGNFGFQGTNCPIDEEGQADRAKSLTQLAPDGTFVSPDANGGFGGWPGKDGLIFRPQGIATDRRGDVWVASCGNDNVVGFLDGDPDRDRALNDASLERPFDVAIDPSGRIWASGNGSDSVVAFERDGTVAHRIRGKRAKQAGIDLPMGIASDSKGNIWVSNSSAIRAPCDGLSASSLHRSVREIRTGDRSQRDPSVGMIRPGGRPHPGGPFTGGGLIVPWGIAIDGADQVWVANFDGRRLSHLCGVRTRSCPAGKRRIGAAISPRGGYGFAGLVRNTGVAIDPSGNVWLANNWRTIPNQPNPGGHQMVVFLGLATPVKTPLLGFPRTP